MATYADMLHSLSSFPVLEGIPVGPDSAWYFVDPANGSDSNDGLSLENAFETVSAGEDACTASQHDVVVLLGGATAASLSDTLTWDKSYTHLIGLCAPTGYLQRAVIDSTTTNSPMVNITASGCIFKNVQFSCSTVVIDVQVTGDYNYFENCHFAGIGSASLGDNAASRSLVLSGCYASTFKDCHIGLETIKRSTANAEIEFASSSRQCLFEDCFIASLSDSIFHQQVMIGASGITRYVRFKNCVFMNVPSVVGSGALDIMTAFNVDSSAGGIVLLENPSFVGCTDIAAYGAANVYLLGHSSDDYSDYSDGVGKAVVSSPSLAGYREASGSDSVTVAETITRSVSLPVSVSDSVTVSESLTYQNPRPSVSDSVTVTDSVSGSVA